MEEIWKDVSEYEGLYKISSTGRLKSFIINKNGTIIKPKLCGDGYHTYCLHKNGKTKYVQAHRLVAIEFIPNDDVYNKIEVGHKDETRDNNCVENLEWVTPKENNNMPLRKQRISKFVKQNWKNNYSKMYSAVSARYETDEFNNIILTEKEKDRRKKISNYQSSIIRYATDDGEFHSLKECAEFYGENTYQIERYIKGMQTKLKETLDTKHFRKVCQ